MREIKTPRVVKEPERTGESKVGRVVEVQREFNRKKRKRASERDQKESGKPSRIPTSPRPRP